MHATGPNATPKNQRRIAITQALIPRVERIRMFGAATIDLAYLASGHTDAAILDTNKPWDITADILLAREAGATITDLHGQQHTHDSAGIIAAAPHIASQIADLTH